MVTERPELYLRSKSLPLGGEARGGRPDLAGAAAAGPQALDLASLSRRHVVRTAAHLAHEPLLLHLAPELAESLFELLRILDYDSHSRKRIPDGGSGAIER